MNRKVQRKGRGSDGNMSEAESATKNKKWSASSLFQRLKPKKATVVPPPTSKSGPPTEREIQKGTDTQRDREKRSVKSSPSGTSLASAQSETKLTLKNVEFSEKTAKSYKKRQSKSGKKRKTKNSTTPSKSANTAAMKPAFRRKPSQSDSKEKDLSSIEKEKPAPVNVEVLEKGTIEFLEALKAMKKLAKKIDDQWDDIELIDVPDEAIQAFLANEDKNQMEEVECLDVNRIRLERQNPQANDYIHASSVELKDVPRKIIMAQLPKTGQANLEDFWSMVYQQNIHNIYLLCHPEESTRAAPDVFGEYFPLTMGHHEYYGQIWVHNRKTETASDAEERPNDVYVVEVLPEGCAESIMVTIYLCNYWPNNEVPTNRKKVAMTSGSVIGAADSYEADPVAIVSKCGAGRAGTFLAITACVNALKAGRAPNVRDIVYSIRTQRPGGVDTELQYVFIYLAALQFTMLHITTDKLKSKVEKMVKALEKVTDNMDKDDTEDTL